MGKALASTARNRRTPKTPVLVPRTAILPYTHPVLCVAAACQTGANVR